jgi:hypothetical protein
MNSLGQIGCVVRVEKSLPCPRECRGAARCVGIVQNNRKYNNRQSTRSSPFLINGGLFGLE